MFDMTFPTPEILNKDQDDDENINQKILHDEQINKQNENLSELFDKNLNKYFNEKTKNISIDLIDLNDKEQKHDDLEEEDKNELTDIFEENEKFKWYNFLKDEDIIDSFQKVFKDYKIIYTPYKKVNS